MSFLLIVLFLNKGGYGSQPGPVNVGQFASHAACEREGLGFVQQFAIDGIMGVKFRCVSIGQQP